MQRWGLWVRLDTMQENQAHLRFYNLSQLCILGLAFLFPFWFLPTTIAPVEFNKVFLVSILVIASFVFYIIDAIIKARISIAAHKVFLLAGGSLVFWFLSGLFSDAGPGSVWGVGAEASSFFSVFVLFFLSYLIVVLFSQERSFKKLLLAFSAGFAVFGIFILLSFFGIGKFLGGVFKDSLFNTIGSWNSVALASAFLLMMIFPFFAQSRGARRWIFGIIFSLFVVIALLVNFPLAWIFLGVFSLLFLSYAIWKRNIRSFALFLGVALLFISILGFVFGGFVSRQFGIAPPIEVSVSHRATANAVWSALKTDLFFGKGPATFRYIWDLYKPTDVNQTVFWGSRFDSGSSYLLSLPGEIGIPAFILFVGFLAYLWYLGLNMVSRIQKERALFLSPFFLFGFTILMWGFYPVGFTLLTFGFFSIGFLLASLKIQGFVKSYDVLLFGTGSMGFVSALAVVLIILGSLAGIYISGTKYAGQVLFKSGLTAFNSGNLDLAENRILLASKIDGRNSSYFSALSQIYTIKSQLVLQDRATPAELLSSKFKDAIDKSFGASQKTIKLSPLDFAGFEALGKIYEFLITLNVDGSSAAALQQYDEALKRAPHNPAIFRDRALAYVTESLIKKNGSLLESAEKELLKAIELKPDYAAAHFLLAQIYDAEGNSAEAIKRGEAAALLAPNDIGALFQIGLLYYKNNRLKEAEIILKRAVSINPNYSNARYFLGLVLDKTGKKEEAISEFEKISSLNSGNEEVQKILSNLHNGKSALAGISPPGPAPEKRKEAPLKDNAERSPLGR